MRQGTLLGFVLEPGRGRGGQRVSKFWVGRTCEHIT